MSARELGCPVCLEGAYAGTQPTFVVATTVADLLYRCEACGTWWYSQGRSLNPISDAEAYERFPDHVPAPVDAGTVIPQGLAPTPLFDAAVIAYVGKPHARIPTADRDAVAALAPDDADALIQRVVDAVGRSDTVTTDDVGPLDLGLPSRLNERFRVLVPGLGVRGRDALTWRWMHRRYDG